MALAYMTYDELKARELFQIQIGDPTISSLTRERAGILLQSLRPVRRRCRRSCLMPKTANRRRR